MEKPISIRIWIVLTIVLGLHCLGAIFTWSSYTLSTWHFILGCVLALLVVANVGVSELLLAVFVIAILLVPVILGLMAVEYPEIGFVAAFFYAVTVSVIEDLKIPLRSETGKAGAHHPVHGIQWVPTAGLTRREVKRELRRIREGELPDFEEI